MITLLLRGFWGSELLSSRLHPTLYPLSHRQRVSCLLMGEILSLETDRRDKQEQPETMGCQCPALPPPSQRHLTGLKTSVTHSLIWRERRIKTTEQPRRKHSSNAFHSPNTHFTADSSGFPECLNFMLS